MQLVQVPRVRAGGPPPPKDAANIARVLTHAAFSLNHAGRGVVDRETPRRMHLMLTDASEQAAQAANFALVRPGHPQLVQGIADVVAGAAAMAKQHFTGIYMPPLETREVISERLLAWEQVLREAITVLGGVPSPVGEHIAALRP